MSEDDKYLINERDRQAHTVGEDAIFPLIPRLPFPLSLVPFLITWLPSLALYNHAEFDRVEELMEANIASPPFTQMSTEVGVIIEDHSIVPILSDPHKSVEDITKRETEVAEEVAYQRAFQDSARESHRSLIMTQLSLLLGSAGCLVGCLTAAIIAWHFWGG